MNLEQSKQNIAWNLFAERSDFLRYLERDGYFVVRADNLKKFGEREPRLMAKLDTINSRPRIFNDHQLNILPLDRGSYVIFKDPENKSYFSLPSQRKKSDPIEFTCKEDLSYLETLNRGLCSTESEVIDLAHVSMLLSHICETGPLRLTRRGRFGSGRVALALPGDSRIHQIEKAQIEVDAVFENADLVVLIEAKNGFPSDFQIRQLYYPLSWIRTKTKKSVRSFLIGYSNGEFQFSEFKLEKTFGDLKLISQKYFVISEPAKTHVRLSAMLSSTSENQDDYNVPFPQANDLNKVIDTVYAIREGLETDDLLCAKFGFVSRQAGYYKNAGRYLGLIDDDWRITRVGVQLVGETRRDARNELIVRQLLSRPIFRAAICKLRDLQYDLDKFSTKDLVELVAQRPDIGASTPTRRSSTVRAWMKWLMQNCQFHN